MDKPKPKPYYLAEWEKRLARDERRHFVMLTTGILSWIALAIIAMWAIQTFRYH